MCAGVFLVLDSFAEGKLHMVTYAGMALGLIFGGVIGGFSETIRQYRKKTSG